MKDPINYVNISDGEKTLRALAQCIEGALASALEEITRKRALASCSRIEKSVLETLMKSSSQATVAMEFRYGGDLSGSALVLMRALECSRLGEIISGIEAKLDDAPQPEVRDACMQFFGRVVEAANRQFSELHGASVRSSGPAIVNSDGKTVSLADPAEFDGEAFCMSFELILDPGFEARLQVVVSRSVMQSLMELLPSYDPNPPVRNLVQERIEANRIRNEAEKARVEEAEAASAGHPMAAMHHAPGGSQWNIDLLLDVELPIVVSFGVTEMQLRDVVKLGVGSVIELDKSVNDPVTLIVNNKPIARGEVVMVDGNYGVRILEIESAAERIRSLG